MNMITEDHAALHIVYEDAVQPWGCNRYGYFSLIQERIGEYFDARQIHLCGRECI